MQLNLVSPVTHIRHLKEQPHHVVVSCMDGCVPLSLPLGLVLGAARSAADLRAPPSSLRPRSSLGVFDLRFPSTPSSRPSPASRAPQGAGVARSTPLLELKGHVNTFTVDLGFDVWRDEWVAAGASRYPPSRHDFPLAERRSDWTGSSPNAQLGRTTASASGPSARAAPSSLPPPPPRRAASHRPSSPLSRPHRRSSNP